MTDHLLMMVGIGNDDDGVNDDDIDTDEDDRMCLTAWGLYNCHTRPLNEAAGISLIDFHQRLLVSIDYYIRFSSDRRVCQYY